MEDLCVHHVEFRVRNGEEFQRKFVQQYKFSLVATRFQKHLKQWVLRSSLATVLLTQCLSSDDVEYTDNYFIGSNSLICENGAKSVNDTQSVFNVALKVKDIESFVQRLSRSGVSVLSPVKTYTDEHGHVSLAIIKSCIGNVVHTLIQDENYKGVFLPGFKLFTSTDDQSDLPNRLVSHLDHVTFACECGDSSQILDWYSSNLGMRRFLINRYFQLNLDFIDGSAVSAPQDYKTFQSISVDV